MLIKELEDMLELVQEMPRDWQMKCVRAMWSHVEEWEERQQEPELSDAEWMKVRLERLLHEAFGGTVETRSGIVETFNREKGYGFIRMEDGDRALLHITCLRAGGYLDAREGAHIEFMALHRRSGGWQAFRILLLDRH